LIEIKKLEPVNKLRPAQKKTPAKSAGVGF